MSMSAEKQIVLGKEELAKAITRMAHEVIEKAGNVREWPSSAFVLAACISPVVWRAKSKS